MHQPIDEPALVRQVLSGDHAAFGRLIRQYEGLVLHIVTPIVGAHVDREDLCQDIFIRVYEKLHTFQHRAKLGTWIGHIAYNMAINFIRKKRNVTMSALAGPDESQLAAITADMDSAEDILIREDQLRELFYCIGQLTSIQQTSLILFYQDELSLEEIAQVTDLPVNTIKSHLFRAKASLKKLLLQHEH